MKILENENASCREPWCRCRVRGVLIGQANGGTQEVIAITIAYNTAGGTIMQSVLLAFVDYRMKGSRFE